MVGNDLRFSCIEVRSVVRVNGRLVRNKVKVEDKKLTHPPGSSPLP